MRIKRILASVLAAAIAVSATAISVSAADPDGSANYVFDDGKTGTAIEVQTVYAPLEGIKTAEVKYEFTAAEKDAFGLYNLITMGFAFVGASVSNPDDIDAYYMTTGADVAIDGWNNATTWSAIKTQAFDGKAADRDITGVKFVIKGKSDEELETNRAAADALVTLRETKSAAELIAKYGFAAAALTKIDIENLNTGALDAILAKVELTEEAAVLSFFDKLVAFNAGAPEPFTADATVITTASTIADVQKYLGTGYRFVNFTTGGDELVAPPVGTTQLSDLQSTATGVVLLNGSTVVASADAVDYFNGVITTANDAGNAAYAADLAAFNAINITKTEATAAVNGIKKIVDEKAVKTDLFAAIYKELAGTNVKGTFYMFGQLSPKAYVLSTPDFYKDPIGNFGAYIVSGVSGTVAAKGSLTFTQVLKPEEASNDFWVKNVINKNGEFAYNLSVFPIGWAGWDWNLPAGVSYVVNLVNEKGGKLEIYNEKTDAANQGKTVSEIAKFLGDADMKAIEIVVSNSNSTNTDFVLVGGDFTYSAYPKGYVVPAVETTTEAPADTTTEAPADTTTAATADDLDEAPNTGAAALVIAPAIISAIATIISKKRK